MTEKFPKFRKNTTEDDDSSVVTRERRQRGAEVEMKRVMGGAPEVVSTIQTNQNTDLETQEVVVKDEPWLRPGVIESALMPRVMQSVENDVTSADAVESPKLSTEEAKRREEKAIGETLGNDIWEELQKLEEDKKGEDTEEGHIPEEISQIYGDQTPPFGVLELYKKLNAEKRAEYITDLRIFEEKNKQQKTSLTTPTVPAVDSLAQEDFERTPQYMPRQRREELQEEINSLGHTPETASMAIANQNLEQLHQIETKPGLAFATEWQDEKVPLGRVMPRMVPADTEPLIQVETKKVSNEAVAHEEEEQAAIDARIAAAHEEPTTPEADEPNRDSIVETSGSKAEFVGEKGTHKKWGDFEDIEHKDTSQTEGTPRENRNRFKEVMSRVKERFGMSELGEKLKGFLSKRSGELDAEAGKMGKGEKLFRTLGEKYNKLPMWQKVALGGSLAVGYGFTLPISSWFAGAYALPLFATRVAAMAGSFENNRKLFETINKGEAKGLLANTKLYKWLGSGSEKSRENTAMAKALIQSFGMTLGLSYVAHEIAEHHVAERIGQWMVEHMPSKAPEAPAASHVMGGKIAEMPGTTHPAAVAAAGGEAAATAAAPEISGIEVTATPGHGYEYMMKRLWEDLHEKGIKLPPGANPDSDLARLLEVEKGDAAGINKLVHTLAEENEWFKENGGTNAVIGEHAKMTIDTHGDIWIDHKDIIAPESASVTPAYHAGAEAPHVSEVTEGKNLNIDDGTRQRAQEFVAPLKSATPLSETLTDAVSSGTIPDAQVASASSSEVSLAPVHEHSVINSSGFEISTTQPHLYTGKGDSIIAFGGQKADRLKEMLNYLKSNPDKTIIAADSSEKLRAVWSLVEGKLEQGALIEKPSFFGFLIPDTSPSPDDLGKIIK